MAGDRRVSELPLRARVAAAKALLEASSADDYDALPASQRAHFEEAIEFLGRIEEGLPAAGRRAADGGTPGDGAGWFPGQDRHQPGDGPRGGGGDE